MRKLECKICHEKWSGRNGSALKFYMDHMYEHNLSEPQMSTGENTGSFMARLIAWRKEHFDDSAYEAGYL